MALSGKTLSILLLTGSIAGCSGGGGTTIDRSFSADVGSVIVAQDTTGIYSPDGREQFVFRFIPSQPRSLDDRIALARASMDQRVDCQWSRQTRNEIAAMTQIDPHGSQGLALMAFVNC